MSKNNTGHGPVAALKTSGGSLVAGGLRAACDTLDDLEDLRISTENRYRALTRSEEDVDGEVRGVGLSADHPVVAQVGRTLDALREQEHQMILAVQREIRKSVFAPWLKKQKGIGEKQAARLLASIGDPALNESTGEFRTLRQLWAYCGYAVDGGVARHPVKGMSQEDMLKLGSRDAKMRAYLIATSCVKSLGGEKRAVYDAERARLVNAVHSGDCKRCGPSGKPALAGSPLSDGHKHARAVRKISKEVLRDLWMVAREAHGVVDTSAPVE